MDLIAKLDLEKAQLQRAKATGSPTIAARSPSPGKSMYTAYEHRTESVTVAELKSQLEQEKAQRQQVRC